MILLLAVANWCVILGAGRCNCGLDDFFLRNFFFEGGSLDIGKGKTAIREIIRSGREAYEAYVKAAFRK